MMGKTGAQLMRDHLAPRHYDRPDPGAVRLARALADPMFARRVIKAVAELRKLDAAKARALAASLAEALQLAEAAGPPLANVLHERGLLPRLF